MHILSQERVTTIQLALMASFFPFAHPKRRTYNCAKWKLQRQREKANFSLSEIRHVPGWLTGARQSVKQPYSRQKDHFTYAYDLVIERRP